MLQLYKTHTASHLAIRGVSSSGHEVTQDALALLRNTPLRPAPAVGQICPENQHFDTVPDVLRSTSIAPRRLGQYNAGISPKHEFT